MAKFTESVVEDSALARLGALGYAVLHGPCIAVGEPGVERSGSNHRDVLLKRRLRQAIVSPNSELLPEALNDAWRKLTRVDAPMRQTARRWPLKSHGPGELIDG